MNDVLRCPYCLRTTSAKLQRKDNKSVYLCGEADCGLEIPRDYVDKLKIPRAIVGLVGFTGHGKTVYITALFHLLHVMQNMWPGFYSRGLDTHTIRNFYERIERLKEGELPEGTRANFPLPSLFHFHEVPNFGEWFLSFYDTSGEVFADRELITQQGRFVANSDVAVFFVSIPDNMSYSKVKRGNTDDWPARTDELIDTYLNGVYDAMHVDLKHKQHLIVVLSKADVFLGKLPAEIEDFLMEGSYSWYTNLKTREEIISRLQQSSKYIRGWLKTQGCSGFVNKIEDNFKSVEYTMVSSIGAAPVGDRLATKLMDEDPRRVLDPFLWILEKMRPRWWKKMLG